MDFFESQDVARKKTGLLVFYFVLAVIAMIIGLYLVWCLLSPLVGIVADGGSDSSSSSSSAGVARRKREARVPAMGSSGDSLANALRTACSVRSVLPKKKTERPEAAASLSTSAVRSGPGIRVTLRPG